MLFNNAAIITRLVLGQAVIVGAGQLTAAGRVSFGAIVVHDGTMDKTSILCSK